VKHMEMEISYGAPYMSVVAFANRVVVQLLYHENINQVK
jgi:hypothetical protein